MSRGFESLTFHKVYGKARWYVYHQTNVPANRMVARHLRVDVTESAHRSVGGNKVARVTGKDILGKWKMEAKAICERRCMRGKRMKSQDSSRTKTLMRPLCSDGPKPVIMQRGV